MAKFLKELASGTFHEVDDPDAVMLAYPGQYEAVKSADVNDKKAGWGDPEPGKWADGSVGDLATAAAPGTPLQTGGEADKVADATLPHTHAELDALAATRGIDLSGATTVAEKQAALS